MNDPDFVDGDYEYPFYTIHEEDVDKKGVSVGHFKRLQTEYKRLLTTHKADKAEIERLRGEIFRIPKDIDEIEQLRPDGSRI